MKQSYFRLGSLLLCSLLATASLQAQRLGGTSTDAKLNPNGGADGTSMSSIHNPNLYDGSTNVQVPIFNYEGPNGGSYGVSFFYNTKGIRADQIASQSGLGWSLNAGGSIQRIVKDIPDEFYVAGPIYTEQNAEDYYGGYVDFQKIRGRYAASFETPSEAAQTDVYRDKESDEFIVSAGSLSFTFNIGKTGAIFTHPNRRVKVAFFNAGVPVISWGNYPTNNLNLEFQLTDEQGVVYYFKSGDTESRKLQSAHPGGVNSDITPYDLTSRWVIDNITFPNGAVIRYQYSNTNLSAHSKNTNYISTEVNAFFPEIGAPEVTPNRFVIPASIDYPNNTQVQFIYDEATTRCDLFGVPPLKKIRVSSGNNCLVYRLEQAYFVAAFPGNTTTELAYNSSCYSLTYTPPGETQLPSNMLYRLKLKNIRIWDCAETTSEPFYNFEYDPTPVGIRGSGQDWFGYYNGKTAQWNSTSTPPYARPASLSLYSSIPLHNPFNLSNLSYGLDKSEDINYMKAGILTKVKNAYGGEIQFTYGAHSGLANPLESTLAFPSSGDGFLGKDANDGLRLESVTEKEKMRPDYYTVTSFTYEQGQRFLTGGFFYSFLKMDGLTSSTFNSSLWQSNYVSPHHLVNGSNHGYGKVTATTRNQASELLSRREMTFTNLTDATTSQPRYQLLGSSTHYFTFPFTDKQYLRDWEMALPLEIKEYDQNNRIVKKTSNIYTFKVDLTTSLSQQVINEKTALVEYTGAPVVASNWGNWNRTFFALRSFTDSYRPYTGAALLNGTVTESYITDNTAVQESTLYGYDDRNNLVSIKTEDGNGSLINTRTIYNYAVPASAGTTVANMTLAGLEKVIGTERWRQSGNDSVLIHAAINTFEYQGGRLHAKGQYVLATDHPLTPCLYTGNCGGPVPPLYQNIAPAFTGTDLTYFRKTAEVVLRDNKGNPLESRTPAGNSYKAMIWDMVGGHKLAEANAHYSDIAYSGFEASQQGNWSYNAIGAQAVTTPLAGRSAYWFNYGAVSRSGLTNGKEYMISLWATTPNGVSPTCTIGNNAVPLTAGPVKGIWTYYEGRFQASSSTAVLIVSGASNAYLDELRLFPTNAGMQCWNYAPLHGVSAVSDAGGRITYYEYDKFGRQTVVRDQEGNILSKTEQYTAQ